MALHSKRQFAELCGIPTKTLAIYISRGKVSVFNDLIDDTSPENQYFLASKSIKSSENSNQQAVSAPKDAAKAHVIQPNIQEGIFALDQRLKVLEAKKKERELAILAIKEDKMRGEVIPSDLVKILFLQHFKTVGASFRNSIENVITNIAKRKSLNINEIAEIRADLNDIINSSIKSSIDESKKNISNIISEYSTKRGVGERV
jgi:hypothetical protein